MTAPPCSAGAPAASPLALGAPAAEPPPAPYLAALAELPHTRPLLPGGQEAPFPGAGARCQRAGGPAELLGGTWITW